MSCVPFSGYTYTSVVIDPADGKINPEKSKMATKNGATPQGPEETAADVIRSYAKLGGVQFEIWCPKK